MRWKGRRQSSNVEDRRGRGARRGGGLKVGGIGGIILILVAWYFGIDPSLFLQQGGAPPADSQTYTPSGKEAERAEFVSVVLADTEDVWRKVLGSRYQPTTLVLFSDSVQSACGFASAATGPFYCPADRKVFIDLSFFTALEQRFGAPGDFAQAYVVAHEVGHHLQTLLGISSQVHTQRSRLSKAEGNALSVRQELQADCFSGVWAFHADAMHDILEAGDIEEALNAAAAIGDDRLQRQARGRVSPESFTHGTSAQRARWFRRGLESGEIAQCDTFAARTL